MTDVFESTPKNQTLKDKQLNSSLFLRELAERLVDVKVELTTLLSIFNDFKKLDRNQKTCLNQIRTVIIPFLDESAANVRKSSALLSHIAGTAYAHKINEKKRKDVVRDEINLHKKFGKMKKSSPIKRIEHCKKALSDVSDTMPMKQPTKLKPTMKTRDIRPKNLFNLPTITSNLKPPADGNECKPREMVNLISACPKNSSSRGIIIKHILEKN